MSDEARRTPDPGAAGGNGPTRPNAAPKSPLQGGVMVAGRVPSGGGGWGELSDCYVTIWSRPRETIRRIVTVNPRYGVIPLAVLSGCVTTLERWPGRATMGKIALLLVSCTIGPLMSIALLWIGAWMVREVGRALLDGKAGPAEMRAALAWGYMPQVVALPIALLVALVAAPAARAGGVGAAVFFGTSLGLLLMGLSIWALIIICNTVAEVQGFRSAWKGFLNLLVPVLVLWLAVGLLVVFALSRAHF